MTEAEMNYFKSKMATANQKTQTDFFLSVLYDKPIIEITDFEKVLAELKRHGNNLNQIAKQLNESATFGEGATKVMNECWKSYRAISTLREGILNALIQGERSQIETQ
jgi:hypothetical protein